MDALFLSILRMHKTAAIVILAVLIVRLLLRRAPKKWSYGLWSVVGFRLTCPVSFSSAISLFNLSPQVSQAPQPGGPYEMTGPVRIYPTPDVPMTILGHTDEAYAPIHAAAADPLALWIWFGTIIWVIGVTSILVYGIYSYVNLSKTLHTAVRLEGSIWQSDQIRTPFILGLVRPKIYLPFGLEPDVQRYVLTHERFHLKHLDHWVKPFAFFLLAVHWFDPLVWLSFYLMGKDMEMRTDEAVLSTEANIRKAYSASLLSFAIKHKFPTPSPLAFGESGVKSRIKNVLNWQKPKLWLSIISIILCTLVILACAANEKKPKEADPSPALDNHNYFTPSNEVAAAQAPICTVEVGGIVSNARYYPDGFNFEYDGWFGSTPEIQDSYTITFTPSWECETLTVGEDYYTRTSIIRRSTYELSPNVDGSFTLEVQPADPNYGEYAWYFVPYGDTGKFVERVNFQRTDPWGLYTSVHDVTTTSATLSFNRKNAAEHGQLLTGKAFWIERQEGDFWIPVDPHADQAMVWTGQAYDIPERGTIWKTDWTNLYGELSPGKYRICKTIQHMEDHEIAAEETYYGIFLILEDTPSKDRLLQSAIRNAILSNYGPPKTEGAFACENHVLLGYAEEDSHAVVNESNYVESSHYFYLMVLYQEYELENGTPKLVRSIQEPLGISLETYTDGTCEVLRCWNTAGGARYKDLPGLFPADDPDPAEYLPQQEADCLIQAQEFFTS